MRALWRLDVVAAFVGTDGSDESGESRVLRQPGVREGGEGSEGADVSGDDSAYRLWRGESPAPSIQSLGGKARAANMTPEERTAAARHAATKGARKLGKEGRRLRAIKGVATRKARGEAVDTLQIKGYLPPPLTYGAAIPPGDASRLQFDLAPPLNIEPLKAKRPLPKAGTMAARVLASLREFSLAEEASIIAEDMVIKARRRGEDDTLSMRELQNALSSLRTAGHVVSEPKPGSRREKLWRLA